MAKKVDLMSYWMPLLRDFKDFKEIAIAEESEIVLILEEIEKILKDRFIETAGEYGISRYEKILKILTQDEDLETRRMRVKAKWNDKVPYTERELIARLKSFCGENYTFDKDYANYRFNIGTQLETKGSFNLLCEMIMKIRPCNMVVGIDNSVHKTNIMSVYYDGISNVTVKTSTTNDIRLNVDKNLSAYWGASCSLVETINT